MKIAYADDKLNCFLLRYVLFKAYEKTLRKLMHTIDKYFFSKSVVTVTEKLLKYVRPIVVEKECI